MFQGNYKNFKMYIVKLFTDLVVTWYVDAKVNTPEQEENGPRHQAHQSTHVSTKHLVYTHCHKQVVLEIDSHFLVFQTSINYLLHQIIQKIEI